MKKLDKLEKVAQLENLIICNYSCTKLLFVCVFRFRSVPVQVSKKGGVFKSAIYQSCVLCAHEMHNYITSSVLSFSLHVLNCHIVFLLPFTQTIRMSYAHFNRTIWFYRCATHSYRTLATPTAAKIKLKMTM